MGKVNPRLIAAWSRDHSESLIDPDSSSPIGKRKMVSHVEATLITVRDGTVVYGPEVTLKCIQGCPLELPDEIEEQLGISRLTGWLVYMQSKKYQGYTVVIADSPFSNLYFTGRLGRAMHRKMTYIVTRFKEMLAKYLPDDPLTALSEALAVFPFQPFETRPEWISAWLIEPRRVEAIAVTQRSRSASLSSEAVAASKLRINRNEETADWSFGLCQDIDACIGLLQSDPGIQTLLDLTERGTLFLNYRDKQGIAAPDLKGGGSRGPVARFVTAAAADLKHEVLKAAIMGSLAGIDEDLYPNDGETGVRPVATQVKVLYHRLMYDLVRRCDRSAPIHRAEAPIAWADSPSIKSLREKIDTIQDSYRDYGREKVIDTLEKQIGLADQADEDLALLIVSVFGEWLTQPLLEWIKKYQSHPWDDKALTPMIAQLVVSGHGRVR